MPQMNDRGYVTITELDDGSKRVEIYARNGVSGPTHLVAAYSRCRDVAVETEASFQPWERGSVVSDDTVEVRFNEEDGRVYVQDPDDMSEVMRQSFH